MTPVPDVPDNQVVDVVVMDFAMDDFCGCPVTFATDPPQ